VQPLASEAPSYCSSTPPSARRSSRPPPSPS